MWQRLQDLPTDGQDEVTDEVSIYLGDIVTVSYTVLGSRMISLHKHPDKVINCRMRRSKLCKPKYNPFDELIVA